MIPLSPVLSAFYDLCCLYQALQTPSQPSSIAQQGTSCTYTVGALLGTHGIQEVSHELLRDSDLEGPGVHNGLAAFTAPASSTLPNSEPEEQAQETPLCKNRQQGELPWVLAEPRTQGSW